MLVTLGLSLPYGGSLHSCIAVSGFGVWFGLDFGGLVSFRFGVLFRGLVWFRFGVWIGLVSFRGLAGKGLPMYGGVSIHIHMASRESVILELALAKELSS